MKNLIPAMMAGFFVVPVFSAHRYWSSSPEDNWNWKNGNNFTEGVAPVPGDTVVVPPGLEVHVKADDRASREVVCDPATVVQVRNSGAYVVFDVPEGMSVTNSAQLQTAWEDQYKNNMDTGGLKKRGKGRLTLDMSTATYAYYTRLDVEAGELELALKTGQEMGILSVAEGATASVRTAAALTFAGFEGAGTISQASDKPVYLTGKDTYDFSGTLTENIFLYCQNRQHFTGRSSTMAKKIISWRNNGAAQYGSYVGVAYFGTAGEPSSVGTNNAITLGDGSGGVKYLGDGETTVKNIELDTTLTGPSFIDGGPHGGLTWNGDLLLSTWRGQAVSFAFTGDHADPCSFGGTVSDPSGNYRSAYITKDGTGIWNFTGSKRYISGIAVKNGTLRFDSIAERGVNCALGAAAVMTEDFSGTDSADDHLVPYAYVLGGYDAGGTPNETALLEYTGTTAAKVTTRPAVLNGRGGFKSSSASFDFTGVTSLASGENTLLLDGDGTVNTVRNVTDGNGTVGLEKNGTGTWIIAGTNDFSGPVTVNGGTLRIADIEPLYRWYRLVIRKLNTVNCLALHYIGFYDEDGVSVTDGFAKGTLSTLQAGQVATDRAFQVQSQVYAMGKDIDAAFVFDSSLAGGFFYTTDTGEFRYITPSPDDESTWCRIVLRLPEDANPVTSYDFIRIGSPEWRAQYQIHTWSLEASVDGVSWQEVSPAVSKDLSSEWGYYWASDNGYPTDFSNPVRKSGMPIEPRSAPVGTLPASLDWSVAAGAELVNENEDPLTVSRLTVDAGKGIGKFVNFRFADSGTVDIRNVGFEDDGMSIRMTGDFSASTGFDNVAGWTFLIDGDVSGRYTVSVSGDTVSVSRRGTVVLIR